jgi:hypothetical protein
VLGVLLYRAVVDHLPDPTVYVTATLAGLLVGTVDEIIQWLVPGRFWDFRDIVLNGGAVALVQIGIWRLTRRRPTEISARSIRLTLRLAAVLVLLLILCLTATPQRLSRIARYVPLPSRLTTGSDAICEYGYRHAAGERTVFRSRLPHDRLLASDRRRAVEVARELDAARGGGGPAMMKVSPVDDPFGYEIRVHLFARNRNLNRARDHDPGSPDHRRFMTATWRENLILETFFANTLERSSLRWKPRLRRKVETAQDPEAFYISRVGRHLVTGIGEGRLRALMLALFAVLVAGEVFITARGRRRSPTV